MKSSSHSVGFPDPRLMDAPSEGWMRPAIERAFYTIMATLIWVVCPLLTIAAITWGVVTLLGS